MQVDFGQANFDYRGNLARMHYESESNAVDIRFPKATMGTMEGTNFHVGARRRKNNATSWSRAEAEAMCLFRAAIITGRELLKPDKGQLFTAREAELESSLLSKVGASKIPLACGHGREHRIHSLPKSTSISLARRC